MHEEESLVRRAQNNDREAFAQLYEAYFEKIYRYVTLRLGDEMEAEDITQQVFLNTLRSISSFKWRGKPFSAWLFRIAHNLVTDYLRKKKRATLPLDQSAVDDEPNPEQIAEEKLDFERLLQATKKLTEAQREVLSLRFSSGLPIAEVARVMGRSEGAVKALQHAAILALRRELGVRGDEAG